MTKYSVERIDHSGIAAGTIKDLGLIERIDSYLGLYEGETLSAGETVAGMILNGLGFSNKPLSLTGVIKSAVFLYAAWFMSRQYCFQYPFTRITRKASMGPTFGAFHLAPAIFKRF